MGEKLSKKRNRVKFRNPVSDMTYLFLIIMVEFRVDFGRFFITSYSDVGWAVPTTATGNEECGSVRHCPPYNRRVFLG